MPATQVALLGAVHSSSFVPPKNFEEFFEQHPTYVRHWLVSKNCPYDLIADYEQSLLLYLMDTSDNKRSQGIPDRIASYDPDLRGGSEIKNPHGAWGAYINMLLIHEYVKLIERHKRGGVQGDTVVSLWTDYDGSELPDLLIVDDISELTTKMYLDSFLAYVERMDPELSSIARTIMFSPTKEEALETLGCSSTEYGKMYQRLKERAVRFNRRRLQPI